MTEKQIQDLQWQTRRLLLEASAVPIIVERLSDGYTEIRGTGVLYETAKGHYLVTASHVAKDFDYAAEPVLFGVPVGVTHPTRKTQVFSFGTGRRALTVGEKPDVAVFRFDENDLLRMLKSNGRRFLRAEDRADGRFSTLQLYGYPTAKGTHDAAQEAFRTQPVWIVTTPYIGEDKPGEHELLLKWPDGTSPELQGISGCPVWATAESQDSLVWDPRAEYRLAGVQCSILPGQWIKVVKWKVVDNIIDQMEREAPTG